jgi:cytochrome c oxidase subunit 2
VTTSNNKKSYRGLFLTWAILTIAGALVGIFGPSRLMPRSMSDNMHLTILTMVVFTVAAAPVAAGVYASALYALRHWAHKGSEVPPSGPAVRENAMFVTTWLIVSTLLTVFLLIWGLGALAVDNSSTGKNPLVVDVTGQQWVWSFSYPGTHVSSPQLYLPDNREVEFRVTSKDVTHGFWIVNMGIQVDANVGVITTIHTTPDKLGLFNIRCEQFCGLNHAFMVTVGHVLTPSQFASWLSSQPQQA